MLDLISSVIDGWMDRNSECEIILYCSVLYYCMNYRGEVMRFVGWILMCVYV